MNTQNLKTHNTLTGRSKFEFYKWLDNNRDFAAANTAAIIAAKAQEVLGFSITFSNVNNARQELQITRARRLNSSASTRDRVAELAIYVCELYQDFKKPIPPRLQALKNKSAFIQPEINF